MFQQRLFTSILLTSVLLERSLAVQVCNRIVTIKQGQLQGSIQSLPDGRPYRSFKGIPYAQPPVGDLRFQPPLPPSSWTGVRNATEHGFMCTQLGVPANQASEDCLFLNVYTQCHDATGVDPVKIPVMVFIHGGAFMIGSGNADIFGCEWLLQYNVLLVTMNYRLEALGFLSIGILGALGNAGMKDQVLALRWVKENIAKFGGDPDNVTIFGESAGSCAVTFHIISPMSKGLFCRAIVHSGVGNQDWCIARGTKERAFRIATYFGKNITDPQELLRYLKTVPVTDLVGISFNTRTQDEEIRGLPFYFVPCVENECNDNEPFLTQEPIDALLSKKVTIADIMIGYNSAEGLAWYQDQLNKAQILNNNSTYLVPRELIPKVTDSQMVDFGKRIMKFFTGDKGISSDSEQGVVNMTSDLYISYNTHRFAHLYNRLNAHVYLYRFDYSTDLNIVKSSLGYANKSGACHADDLYYQFYNIQNKDIVASQQRLQRIVNDLNKIWTDFAKTGNPTPAECGIQWSPYSSSKREYLALNEVMTPARHADADRVAFWDRIYCEAGVPCIADYD